MTDLEVCHCGHPRQEHVRTGCMGDVLRDHGLDGQIEDICACEHFVLWYREPASPPPLRAVRLNDVTEASAESLNDLLAEIEAVGRG